MTERQKQRVLLDVDGVLANFSGHASRVFERVSGAPPTEEDLSAEWDMFRRLPAEQTEACFRAFQEPGWCRSIPVYDDAVRGVKQLQKLAHVYFVTSPMGGPNWTHERTEWLIEHFGIERHFVVHTSAKYLCVGDVLVDDKISHVREWQKAHPAGRAVLWSQPYNEWGWPVRASSWDWLAGFVAAGRDVRPELEAQLR